MAPAEVVALVSGYLAAVGESLRARGRDHRGLARHRRCRPRAGERFELEVDGLGSVALQLASA